MPALLFAAILGGAAILGFVAYRLEVAEARRGLQRQMLAVGRLKAREISRWLEERRSDAASAAHGPMFALDVERWLGNGRFDAGRQELIRARLDRLRGDHYVAVTIHRQDGSVLLSSGGGSGDVHPLPADLVLKAMATERVFFTSRREAGRAEGALVHLDAVAPLTRVDAAGSRTLGALVFGIDPGQFLHPLVQWWPTESRSAESLLVQLDGDDVLFLNGLRHRRPGPLVVTLSRSDPALVAAKALRGARGVVEGVDYRGVPVLAFVEAVEGSPWLLISKVDQSEAYASLRDFAWIYLSFVAVAGVLAGLAARMRIRRVRQEALRREHDATVSYVMALEGAEVEREALIGRLQKALEDVKTLRGILPICAACKRIRDDAGYWKQVEAYVCEHTEAQFSHGLCPDCAKRLYPEYAATPAPHAHEDG